MARVTRLRHPVHSRSILPSTAHADLWRKQQGWYRGQGLGGRGRSQLQRPPAEPCPPFPAPPPTLDPAQPLKPPPSTHTAPCPGAGQTPGLLVSTAAGPRALATEAKEKVTWAGGPWEMFPRGWGRLGSRNTNCGRALAQSGVQRCLHQPRVHRSKAEREAVGTGGSTRVVASTCAGEGGQRVRDPGPPCPPGPITNALPAGDGPSPVPGLGDRPRQPHPTVWV